ncbi:MAG: sulfotransferase domain-containing protein, partial [Deltaproteobacteria bacterium]|nr:sulfotransferase domain-containing protein [Deltaproteobacteria bacterium]
IGALKCGTTSLHYYLGLHPEISMSREKELYFFVKECNWYKGVDWYKSHFSGQSRIYGECTPIYTAYPVYRGVAERMHGVVPGAKLIYVVRDPIDRLVSHYVHACEMGREDRGIEGALSILEQVLHANRAICTLFPRREYDDHHGGGFAEASPTNTSKSIQLPEC